MALPEEQHEAIQSVWDELADFPASQADDALAHLMARLAPPLQADNMIWVGAARVGGGGLRLGGPASALNRSLQREWWAVQGSNLRPPD